MIARNDQSLIKELKNVLTDNLKIKDLGEVKYFLGMEVARSKQGITINKRKYALELISDMGYSGTKLCHTPLEQNTKFTTREYDEKFNPETKDESVEDGAGFRKLIGRSLYLSLTRPDLMFSIETLTQFMHEPKVSHLNDAKRIFQYLKGKPGLGLFFSAKPNLHTFAFYDSDWASCSITKRYVLDYCIKSSESLISWKAKKQHTISRRAKA